MIFDYVVVGAGAAGCALANRLSADPRVQVLLLETGARRTPKGFGIPRALPWVLRSSRLVSYQTLPLDGGNQPQYWVRGRGVGGSTLVNGMMYLRGEPSAYDELEAAGNPGWGWQAFHAAYVEIERTYVRPEPSSLNALDELVLHALEATGARTVEDVNRSCGPRAGPTPATIHRGRRTSAARAFLTPARHRQNLHVLAETDVTSLSWQGNRVVGVQVTRLGTHAQISCRTVVLSAGTIETPLLLERSGVGRADLLHAAGITLKVESPHVGERVREQRGQGLQVRLREPVPGAGELSTVPALATAAIRYVAGGRGPLARPAYDVAALRSATGTDDVDRQVLVAPFALAQSETLRPADYPGLLLAGYQLRPTSTGSVHINPADPAGAPLIQVPPHCSEQLAESLRELRRVVSAAPLKDLVLDEDYAGPDAPGASIYHAVGSAAMGPADDDVVDPDLRVRGVRGLRIADLSVLPWHTSGGTAAVAMALGWLAGARLLQTRE